MKDDKTISPSPRADSGVVDIDRVRAELEQNARDGGALARKIEALRAEIERLQKAASGDSTK